VEIEEKLACKIGEFVKFEREGYGEKEELISYCDQKCDCGIVIVQDVHRHLALVLA